MIRQEILEAFDVLLLECRLDSRRGNDLECQHP
jgi:hypothetical protein